QGEWLLDQSEAEVRLLEIHPQPLDAAPDDDAVVERQAPALLGHRLLDRPPRSAPPRRGWPPARAARPARRRFPEAPTAPGGARVRARRGGRTVRRREGRAPRRRRSRRRQGGRPFRSRPARRVRPPPVAWCRTTVWRTAWLCRSPVPACPTSCAP